MSKIYISTTSIKASDCFRPREESLKQQLSQIVFPNEGTFITQFKDTQIYFHLDNSNPSDIIIDAENDYLIKHSQSNPDFCSQFKMIMPSTHNPEETSKFRQVYKILLDETILNKYDEIVTKILEFLKPQLIGRIGTNFLIGISNSDEIKSLLKECYNDEIESIIHQNSSYYLKIKEKTNTIDDYNHNLNNWNILEKALNASNGK